MKIPTIFQTPIPVLVAQNNNPQIDVSRRRRDDSSGQRERADAPQRRRDNPSAPPSTGGGGSSGGSFGGSGSGGGGSFGGGGGGNTFGGGSSSGGGGSMSTGGLGGIGIVVLIVLAIAYFFFSSGGSTPTNPNNPTDDPGVLPTSTRASITSTPRPTRTAGGTTSGNKWTVMIYQDADDEALEQDIFVDMNEAERAGSDNNVQIVSQIDRYRGGFNGDGNWTNTRRYHITQDDDLSRVHSELVGDVGEADMSDPQTLVDFATWAINTYPADKYVLILSDHGMGWPGGYTDPTGGGRDIPNAPIAQAVSSNQMFLSEIDAALQQVRSNTGLDKFELVGLDACLMSSVEVLSALAPSAHYAVTSQETEPSLGWAYTSFLNSLKDEPSMTGGDLARKIVESYITDDQRIVDDQARADFVRGGSVTGGLFGGGPSADQVSQQLTRDITLTAVDLDAFPRLMSALNDMSFKFQQADQRSIAKARQYSQSYMNVFGSSSGSPYIDLGNFIQLLKDQLPSSNIAGSIDNVETTISQTVLSEKHGVDRPGSTGISIYFPTSTLYRSPVTGPQSYTTIANRFASESLWDNFLSQYYTGKTFEASPDVIAAPDTKNVVSPVAGVQVGKIQASANQVSVGNTINLKAQVSGPNVGYIKLFAGFYDPSANSIDIVDMDYLQSPNTRRVNGVYYPDWGTSNQFTINFDWEPLVFGINDGAHTVPVLLTPLNYGSTAENAIYTVDGKFTFRASGESRYARLYMRDGKLQQVYGYTTTDGTGPASQITPQNGDTFVPYERWMDLDTNGNVTQTVNQESAETLTFGAQSFTWRSLDAAAGDYVVGFLVEDLDANPFPTYTNVTVR